MRRLLPALLSILLLAGFYGCDGGSGPTTPGIPDAGGIDLNDELGGLTFEDELPAFGEPSMFAEEVLAEDVDYIDDMEDSPEVAGLRNRRGARFYTLRINWGRLVRPADSVDCAAVEIVYEWDGSLKVDRGAIILKKTILFDQEDYIHERTDRRVLEWTSKTSPHHDGVLVQIIDPPARPDSAGNGPELEPNRVTFTTPQYSRTFSIDELVRISEMVPVNRCGIAVSFNGFLEPERPCPRGFLAGIWKPVQPDTTAPVPPDTTNFAAADSTDRGEIRGHFYGNWIQSNGLPAGHLKGIYGVDSQGRHVFFGKYISLSGQCKGVLRGTYGAISAAPFGDTAGYFSGEWVNRYRSVTGHLKGHWIVGPNNARGMFHGRWNTDCPGLPPDTESPPAL